MADPVYAWPDENALKMGTGTATGCGFSRPKVQDLAEPVPIFITPALDGTQPAIVAEEMGISRNAVIIAKCCVCLLYTSDAADDLYTV